MTSQAKERPILFNGPMVRAILDGRKTVTRRPVKPGFPASVTEVFPYADASYAWMPALPSGDPWYEQVRECPHGRPGDRLWVRETHKIATGKAGDTQACVRYQADGDYQAMVLPQPEAIGPRTFDRTRPSIHMPRWASRILLEITDVRVERLQGISDDQAKAEGMVYTDFGMQERPGKASRDGGKTFHPMKPQQAPGWHSGDAIHPDQCLDRARWAFANLWEKINGEYSWDANPWVWVVEFKRIEP